VAAIISFLSFMESRHNTQQLVVAAEKLVVTQQGVDQVHEIVNSQRTAMEARIKELTERMEDMANRLGGKDERISGLQEDARQRGR
jgi:hypothetical protein